MQEQLNEKLSQLIDDELDSQQALSLLKTLQNDGLLKDKLRRYQIASQVMRSGEYSHVTSDFVDKIHEHIRQEPTYFLPRKKSAVNWQKAALAIAASVALAVVWVSTKVDKQMHNPFGAVEMVAQGKEASAEEMHARFKDYLEAHDNAMYVNSVQAGQPYARVVGYRQE
ncbi:sigma-E factor negative regulatory protein [Methylomonas sp. MO1]|uniref:sigma-E factor negative regulatory protein n=1 Tax=Methylomonas sp. MO1 TaxID=3073619 RepID=UPI0028A35D79|nr:sigma-E factor negative regulatory protein [Methylomonas sp. MO1]MDT4291251.1 sigma-E factor negative regulatory protein [Methylomonas sp. MO1]